MKIQGIDVSKWQGDIDWEKVKADGISFAIIRIGYGKYEDQKDEYFEKNYQKAKAAGLDVGVYHYSYAKTVDEAKLEAAQVLVWLNNRDLDLPIYFDIEDNSQAQLGKDLLNEICKAFCNKIEAAGYWAGIYANKNWATNIIDGATLGKRYTFWIAQYNSTCTYSGNYDMWQYSSTGKVNGINGNVDMNYLYKTLGGKQTQTTNVSSDNSNSSSEYTGTSIVDYLKSINVDSSFTNRKKLAEQNGIVNYTGTSEQNTKLLNILRGSSTSTDSTNYYAKYTGSSTSIVDALKSLGIDSSFSNREKIAAKNGINNYSGTASQNSQLLALLKQGKLIQL